jgi:CHAT domain-containing protein
MHGSDSTFDDILHAMEYDIQKAYLKYKDSDIDVLKQKCTSGRFLGKTLLEAMRISTKKDIHDFLHYATFFAASYYGRISFIVEYTDWIIANCPVSYGEFFDAVENAQSDAELKQIADLYKNETIERDFFTYMGNDGESLVDNNQVARAFELNRRQRKVASYMNLPDQVGWSYFFKARMHDTRGESDSVVDAYAKGITFFKKSKDIKGQGYCIGNLAAKYYELSNYTKSLESYKQSFYLKLKIETSDSSEYHKGLAIALHGMADANNALNNFDTALATYRKATYYYNKANNVDARARSLTAYKNIAKILKKQGKYSEAYTAYEAQQKRYSQLGDQKNVASTYDDLADVLFSLNDYEKSSDFYNRAYKMKKSWGDTSGAGYSKSCVGQALYNLGQYDLAIAAHDTAVDFRGRANDQAGVAYSLKQIGFLYQENGEFTKAISFLDKSYVIYTELEDKANLAYLATKRGYLEQKISDNIKALEYFNLSLKLYKEVNDKIEVGNSYYNLATVYSKLNRLKSAIAYLDSALVVQYETGDLSGQLFSLNYKGVLTEIQYKDNKRCMDIYKQALAIAKQTASPYNIAVCQNSIGGLYSNMGEYSKAKPFYDSSYQIYLDIKDRLQESYALVNFGYYYSGIGNFKEAENNFLKALEVAEQIKNNSAIANAYGALGSIGRVTGQFQKSIDYLSKSIEINTKSDNPWGIASNTVEMGNLYSEQSKYSLSVSCYLRADSIYNSLNSEYLRATPLNNSGALFYHQGNWDSALTYFKPALEILKKYEPEGDFINLVTINMGEVFVEQKNYTEGEKWLKLGLENSLKREDKRNKAIAYRIMAKYNIERQNFSEAEVQAFKAYELTGDSGEIENTTDIYNQIGRLKYELKDYKASIVWCNKTIQKSEPIGFLKFLYAAYYYSALSHYQLGQKDSALRQLKRAIAVMEKISNQISGGAAAQKMFTSGDLQQKMYEKIVEWLLEQGKIEEAISYLEKSNNEALNAKFKQLQSEGRNGDSETQKVLSEAEEKQKALEKLNSEIVKEKSKPADQQKTELIKKLEEYQQVSQKEYNKFFTDLVKNNKKVQLYLSNSVNPEDFKAERKNVSPDMAVLLYMTTEKNLYIFCATHDSVFAKVVPITSVDLSKKIMMMYNLVRNPTFLPTTRRGSRTVNTPKVENPEKVLNEISKELYNILIGAVKKEIGSKTRLAIIPNGDLYYLPFHALIAKQEDKKITYLMDEFTVFYSNRLKFLGSSQTVDMADFRPIAIGNADKSLPFSEVEVNDIKAQYPQALILIGDNATKAQLISQSGNYNVLHFATHGILDYSNFDSSYLVMAPDKKVGDNGHFTLNDIGELNRIDEYNLVVLSACETAVKNDLVEGYPQTTASAFLKAGVETVIASLWQVDDKATSILIREFYNNLKTMNKVEATHKAQIDLSKMKGFEHPYYWAPFAYYGK